MPPIPAGDELEAPGAVPVPPPVVVLVVSPDSRREASLADSSGRVASWRPAGKSASSPPNGPSAIAGQTWVSQCRGGAGLRGSTERTLPPGLATAGLSGGLAPAWRVTAPASLVTSAGITSAGTLLVAESANSVATSFATSLPGPEEVGDGVTAGGSAETFGSGRFTCGGFGRFTWGAGGSSIWTGGEDGGGAGFGATTEPTGSESEEVTVVTVSRTRPIEAEAEEAPTSNTTKRSPASEIALLRILCVGSSLPIAFSRYPKCGQIYYIFR
jgi:hypothetical protein